MRKAVMLVTVGALFAAGAAYAAVTNVYVVSARITPSKSGTVAAPRPVAIGVGYTVGTAPPGSRPEVVRGYKLSFAGVEENTTFFPGCATSVLTGKGPSKCPAGSLIGSGFQIFEVGPTGSTNTSYDIFCRAEEKLFNGGHHNLSLYVYQGPQVGGQPAPCPVTRGHETININLVNSSAGVAWNYSVPADLRHPITGVDAATTKSSLNVLSRSTTVGSGKRKRTIGLFATFNCAHNHQRQIAITFTGEDGVGRTRTALVGCR